MPAPAITSTANPRIRAAAGLRDRRERDRQGRTLIDGIREITRALDGGVELVEAYVAPDLEARDEGAALLDRLVRAGVPRIVAGGAALERLAFGDRSEGIVAVARTPSTGLDDLTVPEAPLVVVVEGVEKPGNLGAILRSADGAGADALIAVDPRTDLFNPNAIRASIGTIFALPVATASAAQALDWLERHGVRPVAAVVDATQPHWDADLRSGVALVLGNEAEGLSAAWTDPQVEPVRIPMHGVADSLNVAAAAAILLFEARRQRAVAGTAR